MADPLLQPPPQRIIPMDEFWAELEAEEAAEDVAA